MPWLTTMEQDHYSPEAYRLLLEISRAANSESALPAVLKAAAQYLDSKVHLDGIAVMSLNGDRLRPHSLYSIKASIEPGDSFRTVASRALQVPLDAKWAPTGSGQ